MKAIESETDDDTSLEALTQALEKSAIAPSETSDTVEQPKSPIEDTAEQPQPDAAGEDDATAEMLPGRPDLGRVDLEIDEELVNATFKVTYLAYRPDELYETKIHETQEWKREKGSWSVRPSFVGLNPDVEDSEI